MSSAKLFHSARCGICYNLVEISGTLPARANNPVYAVITDPENLTKAQISIHSPVEEKSVCPHYKLKLDVVRGIIKHVNDEDVELKYNTWQDSTWHYRHEFYWTHCGIFSLGPKKQIVYCIGAEVLSVLALCEFLRVKLPRNSCNECSGTGQIQVTLPTRSFYTCTFCDGVGGQICTFCFGQWQGWKNGTHTWPYCKHCNQGYKEVCGRCHGSRTLIQHRPVEHILENCNNCV